MINKSFDRIPPQVDFDGFKIALDEKLAQMQLPLGSVAQRSEPAAHNGLVAGSSPAASTILPPPGLVGEIAQFIYQAAPRPVPEIALAAAMGLMAGICGRAYNISGTGLNQYILCLAMTGAGKEAMASGIDKIINAVQLSVPVAPEFIGPSEIASGQALTKELSNKSQSFVSILGEFGIRLKALSAEHANSAELALRRMLLDLYNKSGYGQVVRPSIYADQSKNVNIIVSPAFSLLGESTPERFYEILNEEMISEGLLPRFILIEYNGPRPKFNANANAAQPSLMLVEKIAQLMANAKTVMANRKVINVATTDEAEKILKDFDNLADNKINNTDREIIRQLWNRAHIKALKISALIACGLDIFNPTIQAEHVLWAISIIQNDIKALSEKFESGQIGKSSDEIKQILETRRMIKAFLTEPWEKIRKYCDDERFYHAKIIPHSYLTKRLFALAAFKSDRNGANNAVKRAIQLLTEADNIRPISTKEMIDKYGSTAKASVVSNMKLLD
jgi:hypothetical protein